MDLVIKPTRLCNFGCSFCSSNKIPSGTLTSDKVIDFIKTHNVNTIIVNGGDPLMMPTAFYWDILEYIKANKLSTTLALTTNMWDWYEHPDKWNKLFHESNVSICSSFQYGSGRCLRDGTPFTEKMFLDIENKFFDEFGEHFNFISVITDDNEEFAIKNVELAEQLDVSCKLNGALKSGRQSKLYSREKLFKIYLKIFILGLHEHEDECKNIYNFFTHQATICPISCKKCQKHIRCMNPSGDISMCPALDDDGIKDSTKFVYYKKECLMCKYYNLCCGCAKLAHDMIEDNLMSDCSGLYQTFQSIEEVINSGVTS